MQKDIERIREAGLQVVGVSYDPVETLKDFADKNDIDYLLLSDSESKTIDAYGIRNKAMDGKSFGKYDLTGIPHPGTYVIDKDRVVRAKLFLERYQERHSTEDLLEAAKTLDQ